MDKENKQKMRESLYENLMRASVVERADNKVEDKSDWLSALRRMSTVIDQ